MQLDEISKADAANLRKNAREASTKSDKAQWEQAVALHKIYYSGYSISDTEVAPLYELWGYEDWHGYVENEVGIHVGKANRMIHTAHFFTVKMKAHWNKQVLSLTRMGTLARAKKVTPGNLNAWITKARNMTPCNLDHELLGHVHGTRQMGFKMSTTDAEYVRNQLTLIKEIEGLDSLSEALVSMFKKRRGVKAA
jgi:hypothetical protein